MLNPKLYAALELLFPDGVRIVHEDEPLVFGTRLGTKGELKKWKEASGEQYNVCCPICGDERFRLSISYAWGIDSKLKYPTSKLVNCFNERCQENNDESKPFRNNVRLWLERKLRTSYLNALKAGKIVVQPVIKERRKEEKTIPFPQPDWCSSLDMLPDSHPAVRYIRDDRKFDPKLVAKDWGVVYAYKYPIQANGKDYSWLAGRIFIPTPGGWQARVITPEGKPKYFSCPGWHKSDALYNLDRAREYSYTMLCEGVTDVWRVGGPAIGIFGKSLSTPQVMKIRKNWDLVGVLLDPDTEEDKGNSLRKAMNQLAHAGIKVFRVTLSGQKDAGVCTYDHLWDCIEKSAGLAGFMSVRRP